MKKYIMPTIKVVELENEELLAGSLNDAMGNGVALGKHNNDDNWDDEDF